MRIFKKVFFLLKYCAISSYPLTFLHCIFFSNLDGNANDLDLGQEVEYTISSRTGPGGKLSAENVKVLPVGSLTMPKVNKFQNLYFLVPEL